MDEQQLKELMKMNENNQKLETTFYEVQKGLTYTAKHGKFLFDRCVAEGFTEEQALKLTIGIFAGGVK